MNRLPERKTDAPQSSSPAASPQVPTPARPRTLAFVAALSLGLAVSGCTYLSYVGPNGERFARGALGANSSIACLSLENTTNGLRRIELRGYQTETSQALGTVTEAAVRAAIQGAK